MSDETRARFLAAIAAKVGADRVEEAHVFPAIKQGSTENGVAVVAARSTDYSDPSVTPPHGDPLADHIAPEEVQHPGDAPDDESGVRPDDEAEESEPRLTIYTAKYRLTLKGPDRGKWEFAMQAEADAPLITVENVVRGVQRRTGDIEDPEKLDGDEFRAQLPADAGSGA